MSSCTYVFIDEACKHAIKMKLMRISSYRRQLTIRYYQAFQSLHHPHRTQCHCIHCLRLPLPRHHSSRARTGMVRCLDDARSLQNHCPRGILRLWIDPRAHHSRTTNKRGFFFVYDVRHSSPTNISFPVTTPTSQIHSENLTAIAEVLRLHF